MPRKLTQDEFIAKARQVHGDKYDYSKVEYINASTKVCIICPEHGEFWQTPGSHLFGVGCIKCAKKFKYTNDTFIEESRKIHGDKYDYSRVEYVNNKTKVCIICPEHGEFWQRPDKHLQGRGCPKCGGTTKLTYDEFINKANDIHNYRYDYSKVDYVNTETKVCIICSEHGEFWQTPHGHLSGHNCPYCCGNIKLTIDDFINEAKKVHGDKYDYSKVNYTNYETKVCIICPEHGEFWQTPHGHLSGQGCPRCIGHNKTNENLILEFRQVHGDKYDYSKVDYVNTETKVCIICPEHGEFWQTPHGHLRGQGCPRCKSSILHQTIKKLLDAENIEYIEEKTFDWLVNKGHLYLDLYLPKYNIGIECHGIQHFIPIDFFGGSDGFKIRQQRDLIKFELCKQHNIKIIYYSNATEYPYFQTIINNTSDLLKLINNE